MPNKKKIQNLFDGIAPDYDRLNHLLSIDIDKTWRYRAVKKIVDSNAPLNILDVATGTGDFAISIAKKAVYKSHVTGIDLSEGMLGIGREKVRKAGLSNVISMEQGDCEDLSYAEGSFDRAAIGFGIRNFEDKRKGLSEICRVLKKGGKLVILELSVPGNRVLKALYKIYFLKILPAIGGMVSGDRKAYEYLPASVLSFPKPAEFMRMMEECGFTKVRHKAFTLGICRMYIGEKP